VVKRAIVKLIALTILADSEATAVVEQGFAMVAVRRVIASLNAL
jgi:hypothetical protein